MFKHPLRSWDWLTYVLLFTCFVIMLCTFRDYGIGWDEEWQSQYGERAIRWYTSGFTDPGALTYRDSMYYGSFFEILAQLATRISPLGRYETRHLVNALFGLLGLFSTAKLGRALRGPATGFLAALFLTLTPVYWGNSFFNSKDLPFATLFALSFYYLIRWTAELPRPRHETSLKLATALGLTLAVRIGGILLVGYMVLAVLLWLLSHYAGRALRCANLPSFWRSVSQIGARLIAVCALAYGVMVAWWPYAQVDPLGNPVKALQVMMRFPKDYSMLFDGRQVTSLHLPWNYISQWVLISMPEFLLLALVIGLPLGGAALIRCVRRRDNLERCASYGLMLIALLLPVSMVMLGRTPVYDGLRHLLFLLPLVAVFAAIAVTSLVEHSPSRWLTRGTLAVLAASLVVTVVDCVQLHPYESLFINRTFGGGLAQAAKSYETDYWGISLKEGATWLVENYPRPADGRKIKVAVCGESLSSWYYLPQDRFDFLGAPDPKASVQPDVFLGLPRWGCNQILDGPVLHIVMRQGAPLLYIKQIGSAE